MGRVIAFGSINLDTVVEVEHIARPGETVAGGGVETFPGGKGGNQALAACRAGADVQLVGKVGNDASGEEMIDFYRSQGLSTDDVGRSDRPTGAAFIQVERSGGENAIVVAAGANADFKPADLASVRITPDDVVMSQFEVPTDAIEALFNRARAASARTVLNPAPAKPLSGELLTLTDYLIVNESELAFLAGGGDPAEIAARLLARDDQWIVVTLGSQGALAVSGGNQRIAVTGRAVDAVDATGAGDCFCGVFAAHIAAGGDVEIAIRRANAAAAISVTRAGAATSMPDGKEIDAMAKSGRS